MKIDDKAVIVTQYMHVDELFSPINDSDTLTQGNC